MSSIDIENMTIIGSILTVKASGTDYEALKDLELPLGKSIAELLDDQTKKDQRQIDRPS